MNDLVITGEMPEEQPQKQLIALAKELGYSGELTPGALEDGIRSAMRRTIDDCLELGARLLLLKEVSGHGEFSKRVELLGISGRMARKFMAATQKFSKGNSNTVLQIVGTQTKLLELLVLDDEEIEALSNGYSVGDLNLDAIECMSVSELKTALRDREKRLDDMTNSESKTVKVLKSDLEHKDSIIANLTVKKAYQFLPQTHHVREECLAYQAECELALNSIWALFEETAQEHVNEPEWRMRIEQIWITAHVTAARANDVLAKLKESIRVPADMPDSITSKHWMTDDEASTWILDYQQIERKHIKAKADREQKRIDSQPKGPGRPRK